MKKRITTVVAIFLAVTVTYQWGRLAELSSLLTLVGEANAKETSEERKYRDHYYPGTEQLAPDEMRVIALGTGMPNARMSQAGSCWLVELGNDDKFFFDLGTGCMEKFSVMGIPYGAANKVFLSHLHSDHYGGFQSWWMGGLVAGRRVGVEVWGPSGATPELGTKYAIDKTIEALNWDITSRSGRLPSTPLETKVHEFDYKAINAVVYEQNGVTVRTVPAIHAIDGPVSFILEWNGLKFVFSGDTTPNKWLMKYGKEADIFIHEVFFTVDDLQNRFGWSLGASIQINLLVHTAPPAFGKVMAEVKPRMGVAYHFFNDFDTGAAIQDEIRKIYDGPITLAKDMMVWNVTPDTVKAREIAFSENSWPVEEPGPDPMVKFPNDFGKIRRQKWVELVADDTGTTVQKTQQAITDQLMCGAGNGVAYSPRIRHSAGNGPVTVRWSHPSGYAPNQRG